jgi:hypothetical protein
MPQPTTARRLGRSTIPIAEAIAALHERPRHYRTTITQLAAIHRMIREGLSPFQIGHTVKLPPRIVLGIMHAHRMSLSTRP